MALHTVLAHQSGDGITVCHCPFCGSGQVIGRSDGDIECSFCNQAFLVRVQPMFSAFPQSIDGMPVQIPGMPPPAAPGLPSGGDPMAENAPPGPDEGGEAPPSGQDSQDASSADSDDAPPGDGGSSSGGGPPFAKKESVLRTAAGRPLARGAYVDYLMGHLEGKR